jgi:hypothetical protein
MELQLKSLLIATACFYMQHATSAPSVVKLPPNVANAFAYVPSADIGKGAIADDVAKICKPEDQNALQAYRRSMLDYCLHNVECRPYEE